jgi:hypothetical protein
LSVYLLELKHLATWEVRYLGEVFDRPFPEPLPRWDVEAERLADMWATEHESRSDIVERYRRVWDHSDATVNELPLPVGTDAEAMAEQPHDPAFWAERRNEIEAAARAAELLQEPAAGLTRHERAEDGRSRSPSAPGPRARN